jgi:squalene-hopene/tetraprenyl-beta-curcumene cyclase
MLVEHVFQSTGAIRRGIAWLEGMQTPDGGWSAFEYTTRQKPYGPLLTEQVGIDFNDITAAIRGAIDLPKSLGSPAWEDITARVLLGLGTAGYDLDRPVVWRAREFLRNQQLDHGGFWGRWMVNYLPTTAFVLVGLSAVGDPLTEPWTKRAIDFLLDHQNFDGGWGESELTYAKPTIAGTGPSVPGLTGVVVAALVRIGLGGSRAVRRGVRYLLDRQRPDGGWENESYLHAFFPPQSFYHLSLTSFLHPSEALGCYLRAQERSAGQSP